MSFLKKLFGSRAASAATVAAAALGSGAKAAPAPAPNDPANDPNLIRVYDAYGREMFMTKQDWRDKVLLDHIKKVWDQPDELYGVIVQSLQDGFASDMAEPAQRLTKIDPNHERSAITLAVVFLQLKRLDDAERALRRHIEQHGESGIALTNLAKVQSGRGQDDLSLETLWRALELDPNQENGLGWYMVIFKEKSGDAAATDALRRIAALPGSWRARLWLAREALTARRPDEALAIYAEAFEMAPRPVPVDMLQQVSGDLGNFGHLSDALRLTEPHFQIEVHGLAVGNNLIKTYLDLGRLDAARALIERLYAEKRPDWKPVLSYWDTELARANVGATAVPPEEKYSITMAAIDGPVWLPASSSAQSLFPSIGSAPLRVAFLGSSFEMGESAEKPAHQLSNTPGRISRALPLFLAEQVRFHGTSEVRTIVPWMNAEAPAFAVFGIPSTDDSTATQARSGESPCDYVVVTHIHAAGDPWRVELRLVRTIDARCLATAAASFPLAQPEAALRNLADQLVALLEEHAGMSKVAAPTQYRVPRGEDFGQYLIKLEQLLAVRFSLMEGAPPDFLSGVRDIIDANLQLCLSQTDNVAARIILAETLVRLRKVHPKAVDEFRDRVLLLQKEKLLPADAHGVVQRLFAEAYP